MGKLTTEEQKNQLMLEAIRTGNPEEVMKVMFAAEDGFIYLKESPTTDEDIVVGRKFYTLGSPLEGMMDTRIDELIITHVRSGVAFYTSKLEPKGEHHFPLGCVFHRYLVPAEIVTDVNSDLYRFRFSLCNPIVLYKNGTVKKGDKVRLSFDETGIVVHVETEKLDDFPIKVKLKKVNPNFDHKTNQIVPFKRTQILLELQMPPQNE